MLLGGLIASRDSHYISGLGGHSSFGIRALRGGLKCFWGVLRALTEGRSRWTTPRRSAPWNPSQKCHTKSPGGESQHHLGVNIRAKIPAVA